ncbi:hypothetical protein [Nostoc sp. LPT]|nr:hypothetical protein [Nostoc sp. LPT]
MSEARFQIKVGEDIKLNNVTFHFSTARGHNSVSNSLKRSLAALVITLILTVLKIGHWALGSQFGQAMPDLFALNVPAATGVIGHRKRDFQSFIV